MLRTLLLGPPVLLVAGAVAAAPSRCFDATYGGNSKGSTLVFKRRHLQGGGPTWRALIEAAVKARTTFVRQADGYGADMPRFGVPMIVTFRKAETWYMLEDEGEAATFCAGDPALLDEIRREYLRLNKDAKALDKALDGVDARTLE